MKINNLLIMLLIGALFLSIAGVNAQEDTGSLTELSELIKNNSNNQTILLTKNYERNIDEDVPENGLFLRLSNDLVIDGQGHTIDAKNSRLFHILQGKGVTIKNLNVINSYESNSGGAIYSAIPLTIINCTFKNCNAYHTGGAIYCENAATIINSTFEHNFAQYGGAINCEPDLFLENCKFINNSAGPLKFIGSKGGAIYCGYAHITENSTFEHNFAQYGGAIYVNHGLTSDRSNYSQNTASKYGGAIYSDSCSSKVYLTHNNFLNNTCGKCKGSIVYNYGTFESIEGNWFGTSTPDWGSGLLWEHRWVGPDKCHEDSCPNLNPNDI